MGWYIRKSFSFGPVRLNLSKSGLGYSVGVKGARVGAGPRGNYIAMGRYGLYYKQYFGHVGTNQPPIPVAPETAPQDVVVGTVIPTADVSQLTDTSANELLAYINQQISKIRVAPWISSFAVLILLTMLGEQVALWIVGACIVATIIVHTQLARFDRDRKQVILHYQLDEAATSNFHDLQTALSSLASSHKVWRIITSDPSKNRKYSAGAGTIINRIDTQIEANAPPFVEVNLPIWRVALGRQTLYFFPDRALLYQAGRVGAVGYASLTTSCSATRFVEDGIVPSDAKVVGTTWKFVNRDGGPDRRFSNNSSIPVAEYADVSLQSQAGLDILMQCSNVAAAKSFVDGVVAYCSALKTPLPQQISDALPVEQPAPIDARQNQSWGLVTAPVLVVLMLALLFFGPRGNYLQTSQPSVGAAAARTPPPPPLPTIRILRQRGTQIIAAVPADTSAADLQRLLQDVQTKITLSEFEDLGVKDPSAASNSGSGSFYIFRTEQAKIPPLANCAAKLRWGPGKITAVLCEPTRPNSHPQPKIIPQ